MEPLSLAQARERLRLPDGSRDTHLEHLIRAARERVERETGRALISQTWLERRDRWDGDGRLLAFATQFRLLKPPLRNVLTIATIADDGASVVWDPAEYFIDTQSDPGRIALARNAHFPCPERDVAGIEIRFECGYGDTADDVPPDLIEAVAQLVEVMDRAPEFNVALPLGVQGLLAPYRRLSL